MAPFPHRAVLATLAVLTLSTPVRAAEQDARGEKVDKPVQGSASATGLASPIVMLLRNPGVHAELKLSPPQRAAFRTLIADLDQSVWALRDVSPESDEGSPQWGTVFGALQRRLRKILEPAQKRRLTQLVLRAKGLSVLLQPEVAEAIRLSAYQEQELRHITEATRRAVQALHQKVAGRNARALARESNRIKLEESDKIVAVLNEAQKKQIAALFGKRFDLSQVRWVGVTAPELQEADAWINSAPLTLAKLHGRVVALHFWTFG